MAEGKFVFIEVDAVVLDKRADLTPGPSALLPPAVEAGEKRPVEDGAKDKMPRACGVEPAEEGLPRDVLDDDRPGLAVAVAGWRGGEGLDGRAWERMEKGVEKCARGEERRRIATDIDR